MRYDPTRMRQELLLPASFLHCDGRGSVAKDSTAMSNLLPVSGGKDARSRSAERVRLTRYSSTSLPDAGARRPMAPSALADGRQWWPSPPSPQAMLRTLRSEGARQTSDRSHQRRTAFRCQPSRAPQKLPVRQRPEHRTLETGFSHTRRLRRRTALAPSRSGERQRARRPAVVKQLPTRPQGRACPPSGCMQLWRTGSRAMLLLAADQAVVAVVVHSATSGARAVASRSFLFSEERKPNEAL